MSPSPRPVAAAADGDRKPSRPFAWLHAHLPLQSERLADTVRITLLVLLVVTLSETFRIPEAALSAYIVLFISRDDAASTVLTAVISGIAVVTAVLLTIIVFSLSLAEPALRLPLIAVATFAAMYLSRTCTLGAPLFAGGFIIAYGLTLGDQALQLSFLPGVTANTPEFTLPELAFMPPEEALVHFMLWLGVVVTVPVGLVILANLLTGRDPAERLRTAVAAQFDTAAAICSSHPAPWPMLERQALNGPGGLLKLRHLAGLVKHPGRRLPTPELIQLGARLGLLLLAWRRVAGPGEGQGLLARTDALCRAVAASVRSGTARMPDTAPAAERDGPVQPANRPLAAALSRVLDAIAAAAHDDPAAIATPTVAHAPRRLLLPDAFSNPAHAQFAFKVTLAVMLCYLGYSLADWPGIHTSMITCFFVSLATVGETMHKAMLRIIGCLIGAAFGIGTILLLMPLMTDLGHLLLVIAAVTMLAAWVGTGSARISYAGWQIALAFYLSVLQGFGPTLDMETARDRVIGIMIGNFVVSVIFTTIWPVHVAVAVRGALAAAVGELGHLIAPGAEGPSADSAAARTKAAAGFQQAVAQAGNLLAEDAYEGVPAQPPLDRALVAQVQALIVPVGMIAQLADPAYAAELSDVQRDADAAYRGAMAAWLQRCAAWLQRGTPGPAPEDPPRAPAMLRPATGDGDGAAAHALWYRMLQNDLGLIRDHIRSEQAAIAGADGGPRFAPS